MRRTGKDIRILYTCYCQCWQHENIERVRRLENHGWIENIWIRDYDGVVRMSPTERGKEIVSFYYNSERNSDVSVRELLNNI